MSIAPFFISVIALLAEPAGDRAAEALSKFQGEWRCVSWLSEGELERQMIAASLKIEGNEGRFHVKGEKEWKVWIAFPAEAGRPKRISWKQKFWPEEFDVVIEFKGIYAIDDDVWIVCLPKQNNMPQVTTFSSTDENHQVLIVFERVRKGIK